MLFFSSVGGSSFFGSYLGFEKRERPLLAYGRLWCTVVYLVLVRHYRRYLGIVTGCVGLYLGGAYGVTFTSVCCVFIDGRTIIHGRPAVVGG